MMIQIGDRAPDFKAEVYHRGAFKTIQLSDYKNQWVVLVFYLGAN